MKVYEKKFLNLKMKTSTKHYMCTYITFDYSCYNTNYYKKLLSILFYNTKSHLSILL